MLRIHSRVIFTNVHIRFSISSSVLPSFQFLFRRQLQPRLWFKRIYRAGKLAKIGDFSSLNARNVCLRIKTMSTHEVLVKREAVQSTTGGELVAEPPVGPLPSDLSVEHPLLPTVSGRRPKLGNKLLLFSNTLSSIVACSLLPLLSRRQSDEGPRARQADDHALF